MMAYNCSPSFNWEAKLDKDVIAKFQRELGAMGYKFQFVTLAGFHQLNHGMFELARGYKDRGMAAYSELQQAEFASEKDGYTATRHQREVGTGYFDLIAQTVSAGTASTTALGGIDRSRSVQGQELQPEEDEMRRQNRYWVIGGEYEGADFAALVPGTEKLVGPFEDEAQGAHGMDAAELLSRP